MSIDDDVQGYQEQVDKFKNPRGYVVECQGYKRLPHQVRVVDYRQGLGFQYCPPCIMKRGADDGKK